jgi:hypothetical protein
MNLHMEEKVRGGEAVDVSGCARLPNGDYILPEFKEGVDYCDAKKCVWIWSIARNLSDGSIVASASGHLYANAGYECLWLR